MVMYGSLPPEPSEYNHKWIHLDTVTERRVNAASHLPQYTKVDRFYCEHCLDIKEIRK
jgi:hypothetical protein